MPNSTTKVEHLEEARRLLEYGRREGSDEVRPENYAQAHASLAIAEELRGIREALNPGESEEPEGKLADALGSIRGIVLGAGPKGQRESLAAINELVGWALYGDFADSPWVRKHMAGDL